LSIIQETYKKTGRKGFLFVSDLGEKFRFGLQKVYDDTKEFIKAQEDSNDEEFIAMKMVSIFCNVTMNEASLISYASIIEIVQHLNTLFSAKHELVRRFKLGNVEFGFIPDLENISFGEYIDLESNLTSFDTMHKAMAVMYRPIVKEQKNNYNIERYVSSVNYAEVMEFSPVSIALAAQVFFWTLGSELLQATLGYLEKTMTKKQKIALAKQLNLENGGDGIQAYMHSLKEMLHDSMQLPKNHL
jgi:hypothetical protein